MPTSTFVSARSHAGPSESNSTSNTVLEWAARIGYAARGAIYLVIGGLAVEQALRGGGQTTDARGALDFMFSQPFGRIIAGALALGLLGYSFWRLVQAVFDADDHGHDAKGIVVRAGLGVSCIAHASLAWFALSQAAPQLASSSGSGSSGSGSNGGQSESFVSMLFNQPFGRALVVLLGLIIIGVGVAHFIKAAKKKYADHMNLPARHRRWIDWVSQFGLSARGALFGVIGLTFLVAAWRYRPEEAAGFAEAFRSLREQPGGLYLFLAAAFGLIAFGIYSLVEARYRRVEL